jgi:gliding motility-associated-like protein
MIGKTPRFILIIFFLCRTIPSFSQTPAVVISSYYNAADPRDEWTELLVVADNTNMVNWVLQDNNATQTAWQTAIIFNNPIFWNNMRAGTVIIIWHRMVGSTGIAHPVDANKDDGYIEVSANDPLYFIGGNFGTAPLYAGPTLNIDAGGDLLVLQDASSNFIHALGHKAISGSSYTSLPLPKLNYKSSITDGEAVYVCPGASLDEYGNFPPQDSTIWASAGTGAALTFGLPNTCTTSSTTNSDFWRSLRQPVWINPTLTGTANLANTEIILNWNNAYDPFPGDGTMGYLILRNTVNVFGTPVDGHTYAELDNIGGAIVRYVINYSQFLTIPDGVTVPCPGGLYYRIYSFRYGMDDTNGNDFDVARGTANNETSFGAVHIDGPLPVAPVYATCDRNNFCADDPGDITISAFGGYGIFLSWYTGSCGGTLIGSSGAFNDLTISSPTVTTTYYARWESACGLSDCVSVTVTVIPDSLPASITISANTSVICPGTIVTFIATPLNEGSSPVYDWLVDGVSVQQGSSPVYTTNALMGGESIICRLTSSLSCLLINPVESPPLSIPPAPAPVVKLTDKPYLCAGEPTQLDAGPGFITYLWQDGSTGRYFTATNEGVYRVMVTDSLGCSASDSVLMKICDALIVVPDAFTPNDDGLNDEFKVITSQEGIITFSIRVYNRWGEMVFESSDVHHGWNGKVNGRNAPPDTYAWKIVYKISSLANPSTSTTTLHGTVTLIR